VRYTTKAAKWGGRQAWRKIKIGVKKSTTETLIYTIGHKVGVPKRDSEKERGRHAGKGKKGKLAGDKKDRIRTVDTSDNNESYVVKQQQRNSIGRSQLKPSNK